MIVVGLDPGLSAFGVAVCNVTPTRAGRAVLGFINVEVMTTARGEGAKTRDSARRFGEVGRWVRDQLQAASLAVVESLQLPQHTSRAAVSALGRARGLVDGVCVGLRIPLLDVSVQAAKKAACRELEAERASLAYIRDPFRARFAPKTDVINEVSRLVSLGHLPEKLREHGADAVAAVLAAVDAGWVRDGGHVLTVDVPRLDGSVRVGLER